MNFSANLKYLRKLAGLQQKPFGVFLGVSQAMICRLEKGIQYPSPETLELLVKISKKNRFDGPVGLKIRPAWLHPDILSLPREEFLDKIGQMPLALPVSGEQHKPDATEAPASGSPPPHPKKEAEKPETPPHSAPEPPRRPTGAASDPLSGFFAAFGMGMGKTEPVVYAVEIRAGGGPLMTLVRLGINRGSDRRWQGAVQHEGGIVHACCLPEGEPFDPLSLLLLPVKGRPYQQLFGSCQSYLSPRPAQPGGQLPGFDHGYIGLFRFPDETSLDGLIGKLRDLTGEQQRNYHDELAGMLHRYRLNFS